MAIKSFPVSGAFDVPAVPGDFTAADFAAAQEAFRAAAEMHLGGEAITAVAMIGSTWTPTACVQYCQSGSGTSGTITQLIGSNFRETQLLMIRPYSGHTITITNAFGIYLRNDENCILSDTTDFLLLERLSAANSWREVCRAERAHGKELFTASGSFTVPVGVRTIWATVVGGGGGGGGGGGCGSTSAAGSNGSNGSASAVNASSSGGGGYGGGGGPGYTAPSYGGKPGGTPPSLGENGQPGAAIAGYWASGGNTRPGFLQYGRGGYGGGGGASADGSHYGGGGGASGAAGDITFYEISTTPGAVLTVTVGAGGGGGAGGTGSTTNGYAGIAGGTGCVLLEW